MSTENEQTEPAFGINLGDTRFEMTRRNTYLYTFMGKAALYNHVFLKRDDLPPTEDGDILGTYLFQDVLPKNGIWDRLCNTLQENDYPQYLNHAAPSEGDKAAYMLSVTQDLQTTDTIPEGWE